MKIEEFAMKLGEEFFTLFDELEELYAEYSEETKPTEEQTERERELHLKLNQLKNTNEILMLGLQMRHIKAQQSGIIVPEYR